MPYVIHKNNGLEFFISRKYPLYNYYCDYSYCIQEYGGEKIVIPIQLMTCDTDTVDGWQYKRFSAFGLDRERYINTPIIIDTFKLYDGSGFEFQLPNYTRGFVKGYNTAIKPEINTPEAKMELVYKLATHKQPLGWVLDNDINPVFSDSYEMGGREGLKYKAWTIIQQAPGVFEKFFSEIKKQFTFSDYLTGCKDEANKQEVMEYVKNEFAVSTKKNITAVALTIALQRKGYLTNIDNQTVYHSALTSTFGDVGQRNRFSEVFGEYTSGNRPKLDNMMQAYRIP